MPDFNKAAMLLHVLDKAKNWPGDLKGLHDAAMFELREINAEALEELADRAKEMAAKQAKIDADAKTKDAEVNKDDSKPAQNGNSRRTA